MKTVYTTDTHLLSHLQTLNTEHYRALHCPVDACWKIHLWLKVCKNQKFTSFCSIKSTYKQFYVWWGIKKHSLNKEGAFWVWIVLNGRNVFFNCLCSEQLDLKADIPFESFGLNTDSLNWRHGCYFDNSLGNKVT